MSSNTQNFRVKHGLDVTEGAAFSNTVTIQGNTTVSGKSLVITGGTNLAINAQGTSVFGNTVTVSNGGVSISSSNSTNTTTFTVNATAVTVNGSLTITGSANIGFSDGSPFRLGSNSVVLLKDQTGSPATNASIVVQRGDSANVAIIWNELTNTWQYTNDGTNYFPFQGYAGLIYEFSANTTTNADPGNGIIRFNNSTFSSVTEIAIDLLEYTGANVAGFLATIDDSAGSPRAFLSFRSLNDPSKHVIYNFDTNIDSATSGVYRFTVTHLAGGTSAFSNGDLLQFEFDVTGNRGYQGFQGFQGFQGHQGHQGNQGYQGPADGFQGAPGGSGTQGAQGNQGNQGTQGAQGVQGATGTGSQGDQGAQGYQGLQGPSGGAQGDQGFQGLQGAQGATSGDTAATPNTLVERDTTADVYANNFYSVSDISLKQNITSIENPLSIIDNIKGVKYQFKGSDKSKVGFIAQELEKVLPEAVTTKNNIKVVSYDSVISVLVEAVKELKKKIGD